MNLKKDPFPDFLPSNQANGKRTKSVCLRVREGNRPYDPSIYVANESLRPRHALINGEPVQRLDTICGIERGTANGSLNTGILLEQVLKAFARLCNVTPV